MSQYTIEVNYDDFQSASSIKMTTVKPFLQSCMQSIVDELSQFGWSAHKIENDNVLNVRFWLNDNEVKKIVERDVNNPKKNPKFRNLFIGFFETVFGAEAKQKFFIIEKEVMADNWKKSFTETIENQLLGFKGMPGISVKKGNKNLFENSLEQPKKFKLH